MKFKALPFIDIEVPTKKYKSFLLKKFEMGHLFSFEKMDTSPYFVDWRGTNMGGDWCRFVNPHCGATLDFFVDSYKIHIPPKVFVFPFPTTINEFISDCERVGLDLYWNTIELDKLFEIRTYLPEKDSKQYYKNLLTKINKEDVF